MAEEFVPFEEALKSLKMSEQELKRLVSQDEIQAVRDPSGNIRLRKDDIERLLRTEPEEVAEELVFADDEVEGDDTGMVTAVLEEDSLLEEEETLDLSPEEIEVTEPVASPRGRRAATPVRSRGRAAGLRPEKPEGESTLDKVLLIGTAVLLLYSLFFAYSIAEAQVTGVTKWLADMFKVQ